MDHYRIIEADYALVGLKSDIAAVAPGVADMLRRDGLRVGLVMLEASVPLRLKIADLLECVLAVGVIESERTKSQIAPALLEILKNAARTPDWHFPGRIPRVYSAVLSPGSMAPRREHLIELAKAMHVYAPDRLILTGEGLVKPARSDLRPVRRAAVA
jgi:pyruvate/2-oxoacid:ferredoxin oxidoreductase alpha subunit